MIYLIETGGNECAATYLAPVANPPTLMEVKEVRTEMPKPEGEAGRCWEEGASCCVRGCSLAPATATRSWGCEVKVLTHLPPRQWLLSPHYSCHWEKAQAHTEYAIPCFGMTGQLHNTQEV